MYAFRYPHNINTKREWINWVYEIKKDPENRWGLEFVEDWDGPRICIISVVALVSILGTCAIWVGYGGDLSVVFTVAGFALACATGETSSCSKWTC